MSVERTLLWTPRAKQRPRAHVVRGKAITFTPRETMQAERDIAAQWEWEPMAGPIAVGLRLYDTCVAITVEPMRAPDSRKLRGDIDNYAKLVLDALNGRAWVDDHQIAKLSIEKV